MEEHDDARTRIGWARYAPVVGRIRRETTRLGGESSSCKNFLPT